ncbi:hypothetical protein JQ636_25070 [Bradyrhizobium japonicum]|uniref:hypothetical protein n=1 Tax=Bradyrhizobium japonicum TaxID=375 RepID=UPI001BAA99EF|nr:hypothetical protein [Bradyrhizobium japonicum]MBR0806825.1 hypothetical protein [Bradyrhizobium japonicum]
MAVTNIGKWYDPISERWILRRETKLAALPIDQVKLNGSTETRRSYDLERIWDALVECCMH